MFVFYDTETTGFDEVFTRILQTGMLFTGDDLEVLSSLKIDGRNAPWDLPSPGSLLTTGFATPNIKNSKSKKSNYEMMQEVYGWLKSRHWPLTFIGYNSISYDEPILAQNFYQNLLPPDVTTRKNPENGQSNGRADVMKMAFMADLYMHGSLKLDIMNNNLKNPQPSMTLTNVAQQNGVVFSSEEAHDAMNDVWATVGIAKVIQKAAPQVWEQALKLSTIAGVNKFLEENDVFTYTNILFGGPVYKGMLTSLVEREDSTEQVLFDLRADPTAYISMSIDELKAEMLKDGNPFKSIRKEEQPILMPLEQSEGFLAHDDLKVYDADITVYQQRAHAIKGDMGFLANVAKATVLAKQERDAKAKEQRKKRQDAAPKYSHKPPPIQPETMINKRVPEPVQIKLDVWAKEFREAASWHDRAVLTKGFREYFREELAADASLIRFEKLATRLVFDNAPEQLNAEMTQRMYEFIAARLLNPDLSVHYMTVYKAREELNLIENPQKPADKERWKNVTSDEIKNLRSYYSRIISKYEKFLPEPPANSNEPVVQDAARKPFNGTAAPAL